MPIITQNAPLLNHEEFCADWVEHEIGLNHVTTTQIKDMLATYQIL